MAGSFHELEKKLADIANKVESANDNQAPPAKGSEVIKNLSDALGTFMTKDEVDAAIVNKLSEYHQSNTIKLISPEGVEIKLDDAPRHFLFGKILQTVNMGIPVAMIGPAGSGKSTVSEQIASALGMRYYLQNGVQGEHQLTGYRDAYGKYQSTNFRQAFEHGGFLFVDEADTSDAGAFKWINTAIANGHATFPDQAEPVKRHKDFRIAIGANTYGTGADRVYVGANQLDASTLDRFVFFDFGYDEKLEVLLCGNAQWAERVQQLRKAAGKEKARVVISPRASLNGAKLLAAGWDQKDVEQATIWKGMDAELKERIIKAA